jgi:hypothetical protein
MKINLIVDLDIHAFSGSGITEYVSGLTNCSTHSNFSMADGEYEVTQRPSIDITEDATTIGALNMRGRGIYYWEQTTSLYIVHDNDVYADTQDSTALVVSTGTFATGTERVYILETIGVPRLVFLDPENDRGFYMGVGETLNLIASNFPTTLCHGGAVLDSYIFVMDEDGFIYNSDPDDPTVWNALSFLEAERENDKGVYLGKHHDHIFALGTRTIEFFYDAGNNPGSPLNRRQDISYNIGCGDGQGVWENGDITYFIGSNPTGHLAVYKMENFKVQPISNDSMNSYLTQGLTQETIRVVINGMSAMGHDTLLMTIYVLTGAAPGTINPVHTFSYDTFSGKWGFWVTELNGHNSMPIMAFTKRTGGHNAIASARPGEGILANGDIVSVNDKLIPIDTLLGGDGVYEAGVYEDDIYVIGSSDVGTNISCTLRTGLVDGGIRGYKFQNSEYVLMENTPNSQTITIKHSDEAGDNFDSGNTIDTSDDRKELYQGGRFMKRNFQLEYSGSDQFFIESFHADLEAGE